MTQVNGLLTQKPESPEPAPGSTTYFEWEEKTGKSGKPYIKIKNSKPEYGQSCEVVKAEKTDFQDSHGNVSFNVSFIPQDGEGGVGGSGEKAVSAPPSASAREDSIARAVAFKGAIELTSAQVAKGDVRGDRDFLVQTIAERTEALLPIVTGESADPKDQAPKSDDDIPF